MVTVPAAFVVEVLRREGEASRRWLESLPDQVAFCCADWGLTEPAELTAHLDTLCAVAALDRERVRAWSLLRCLDYWLWGLSVGLTEDPPRCARVVNWLGWR